MRSVGSTVKHAVDQRSFPSITWSASLEDCGRIKVWFFNQKTSLVSQAPATRDKNHGILEQINRKGQASGARESKTRNQPPGTRKTKITSFGNKGNENQKLWEQEK